MALEMYHVPYEHKNKPKPKEKVVNNTADHYGLDDFAVVDALLARNDRDIIGDGSWGAKSDMPIATVNFEKQLADFAARNPDVVNEPTYDFKGTFNSFSINSVMTPEDIAKLHNATKPGKMQVHNDAGVRIQICESGLSADRTYNFPDLEPEGNVVIWSPDAPLQIRGPIRGHGDLGVGGHDSGTPEPPSAAGDLIFAVAAEISEGDTLGPLWTRRSIGRGRSIINRELPSLEKIMDETRRLKKTYDKWIKFEQVTGHWNKTVKAAMRGNKKAIAKMNKLRNRQICIMGTAWKGDHWGPDPNTVCSACERLGNDMLHSFTRSTPESTYYPTVMERFEEYKIMFEWHWNTAHADNR